MATSLFDPITAVLLCTTLLTLAFFWRAFNRRRLPPGPRGWPFVGNALQMDPIAPHLSLTDWAHKYGDVYMIRLFGSDYVVLSGDDVLRRSIVTESETFAGRSPSFRIEYIQRSFNITFVSFSDTWSKLKKLTMNALKMYGDGLKRLEAVTVEVANDVVEAFDRQKGAPFDPEDEVVIFMTNVLFLIAFNRRLERHESLDILDFEEAFNEVTSPAGPEVAFDLLPILRHFPHKLFDKMDHIRTRTDGIFGTEVKKRKEERGDDELSCVIDALLKYQATEAGRDGNPDLSDDDIKILAREILGAGITTSSGAILAFIAICSDMPNLQERLQQEIDDFIGDRTPRFSDKTLLPLMEATILELLRYIAHVPLAIAHMTTRDVCVNGYFIPKETPVLHNIWSLHHDPRYWKKPWEFQPERFLTEDGKVVPPGHINKRRMMAFGAGRRVCVGEVLAKNRLFLLMVLLLQRFTFSADPSDKPPNPDPRAYRRGIVLFPQRFKICATRREILSP